MAIDPVVDVATAAPLPALRPYVAGYTGYRLTGFDPGTHRGLPGKHLTFIISLGGPVDIASMPVPSDEPVAYEAFLSGYHAGPVTIRHDGTQVGVALDLTPLGCRHLLGLPPGEVAATVVPLDAVLGPDAERLCDRLASATGWADRFAVLDSALAAKAQRQRRRLGPRPEVVHAWERVVASGGRIEIGALASELGWSRRHLGATFSAEIGLSPKEAARVVRFDRSRRLIEQARGRGLADVAAAAGYYDQAHLNREWRALAGCSPTTWMAEEDLPIVQDPTSDGGAPWPT